MARHNQVDAARDSNLLAGLMQSATTVAGIAVALDAALYLLNAQLGKDLVSPWLVTAVAAAAGMCITASIALMTELIRKHPNPLRAAFVHWDYALMLTANFLLLAVLVLLHWR